MKIDTIIFDMDGVLIDSEPVYLELIGNIYREIGADVPEEVHLASLGSESEYWWKFIIDEYDVDGHTPEELAEKERKAVIDYLKDPEAKERIFNGLIETLEKLKEQGFTLAIASSSARHIVERVLEIGELGDYFDLVVSGADPEVKESKPAPDIFLHAAKLLGKDPQNCLVVEDSESGLKAAHRAGMRSLAFLSAPKPVSLEEADYTFDDYRNFFTSIEDLI